MRAWCLIVGGMLFWPSVSLAIPDGKHVYIAKDGQEAQAKGVNAAIEKAASQFNLFIRRIARKRLHEKNPVFSTVTVEHVGKSLNVSADGQSLNLVGAEGETTPWVSPTGLDVEVSQFIGAEEARRIYVTEIGRRVVLYQFGEGGKSLTLDITVHSKHLSEPLHYQLQYVKEK